MFQSVEGKPCPISTLSERAVSLAAARAGRHALVTWSYQRSRAKPLPSSSCSVTTSSSLTSHAGTTTSTAAQHVVLHWPSQQQHHDNCGNCGSDISSSSSSNTDLVAQVPTYHQALTATGDDQRRKHRLLLPFQQDRQPGQSHADYHAAAAPLEQAAAGQQHSTAAAAATTAAAAAAAADKAQAQPCRSLKLAESGWLVLQADESGWIRRRLVSVQGTGNMLRTARQVIDRGSAVHVAQLAVVAALWAAELPSKARQQAAAELELRDVEAALTAAPSQVADHVSDCLQDTAAAAPAGAALEAPAARRRLSELKQKIASLAAAPSALWPLQQQVLTAVAQPTAARHLPPLQQLHGRYLQELLQALHLLMHHAVAPEQQQQQQQLQQQLLVHMQQIPHQHVLSAVRACESVQQLEAVLGWLQDNLSSADVLKAAWRQLVTTCQLRSSVSDSSSSSSSSSGASSAVLAQLLVPLQRQVSQLQPHQSAEILWCMGHLSKHQHHKASFALNPGLLQQLLHSNIDGMASSNLRVCAMLLHGAAQLQLQLPEQGLQGLLLHSQQHMAEAGPQELAVMVWALGVLGQQPSEAWQQQLYDASYWHLQVLQAEQPLATCHDQQQQQQQHDRGSSRHRFVQHRAQNQHHVDGGESQAKSSSRSRTSATGSDITAAGAGPSSGVEQRLSFRPCELSALLSGLAKLHAKPHSNWLDAAAAGCWQRMRQCSQQELAVSLHALTQLGHQLQPEELLLLLDTVCEKAQEFTLCSLSVLLYALTRQEQQRILLLQQQQQQRMLLQQEQQHSTAGTGKAANSSIVAQPGMATAAAAGCIRSAVPPLGTPQPLQLQHLVQKVAQLCMQGLQQQHQQQQSTALDLSVIVWALGWQQQQQQKQWRQKQWRQQQECQMLPQWQQQQQQQQQQPLPHGSSMQWLPAFLSSATQKLQTGAFNCQSMSMMLWGLGKLVSCQQQPPPAIAAPIAPFWTALQAQSLKLLPELSTHEICNLMWGAGCFAAAYPDAIQNSVSNEWADLFACQCLDSIDQMSMYQALAALQGLLWLQHPRGVNVLQAILSKQSSGSSSRPLAAALQPQELLLLLRAVVKCGYLPDPQQRQHLLAAAGRLAQQMTAAEVGQLLYLLGKVQQQYSRQQRQATMRQLLAASAAARQAAAAARSFRTSRGRQNLHHHQQQQQQQVALGHATWASLSSSSQGTQGSTGSTGSSIAWQQQVQAGILQQQQQQQQMQLGPLVPVDTVCRLVAAVVAAGLEHCSPRDVTLMVWGLAQLLPGGHLRAASVAAGTGAAAGAAAAGAGTACFAESKVGQPFLQDLYPYTLQWLDCFQSSHLTSLLYALHKLGVQPPTDWLAAVVDRKLSTPHHMQQLNGQDLAALVQALSGCNYEPSAAWLATYVDAAAAGYRAGALVSEWQQAGVRHGLAALDLAAGQFWDDLVSSSGGSSSSTAYVPQGGVAAAHGTVGARYQTSSKHAAAL